MAETQLDRIEALLTETRADVKEVHNTLHVDDGPSKPSHSTRLDRLEQSEQRRTFLTRAAIGASVTAFIAGLYAAITGR